ncbi:hypothetical protein EV356DRAFT_464521 [Viridothelium virens]|uniref:HTH CENPB-type domain-containing protein n=1 Tax=Viridothelium virens TaxID=1048519 RepID=A0A6A6HEV7_VIRVR|nr:hypothetical protein EV356DRAFT_464521 [Viridothelium virens]
MPSNANNSTDSEAFRAAIAAADAQKNPNYSQLAREFGICRSTLSRRHRGVTQSIREVHRNRQAKLSELQERSLVTYINKLSQRGIPSTSKIVRNLAENIAQNPIGKSWLPRFIQ